MTYREAIEALTEYACEGKPFDGVAVLTAVTRLGNFLGQLEKITGAADNGERQRLPMTIKEHALEPLAAGNSLTESAEGKWVDLFKTLADPLPNAGRADYGLRDIKESAEKAGILEILIGDVKSPNVALGRRIKSGGWMGRQLTDSHGRPFEIRKYYGAAGSLYRVINLLGASPEKEEGADLCVNGQINK